MLIKLVLLLLLWRSSDAHQSFCSHNTCVKVRLIISWFNPDSNLIQVRKTRLRKDFNRAKMPPTTAHSKLLRNVRIRHEWRLACRRCWTRSEIVCRTAGSRWLWQWVSILPAPWESTRTPVWRFWRLWRVGAWIERRWDFSRGGFVPDERQFTEQGNGGLCCCTRCRLYSHFRVDRCLFVSG